MNWCMYLKNTYCIANGRLKLSSFFLITFSNFNLKKKKQKKNYKRNYVLSREK